ncbi:hypothetical protein LPB140_04870 [Sphingorhabdus lutea]|uniref:17 kDa surface antigen n=1 Tax=Sphingorhabdus lutea TaxID=1913578 RepID=A0A1L3JB06_9SPHN|nr:hypothetical protein [Sphingorhabdus lutea]APG62243.1 hypothetical protein LPB140_04870 [Sphingorhabdus lutea]
MTKLGKALTGTLAAGAMAVSATPAFAQHRNNDDGISAGEVIAGAVILGGLAAILSSGKNKRSDGYDYRRGGYDRYEDSRYGYNRGGNGRYAVDACVRHVENYSNRYNRSDVTEISDIDRTRYGYKIKGKLVVQEKRRGRYNNGRYNGYRDYDRGYDKGRFTCYVEQGRVTDVRFSGLDNWR